MPNFYPVCNENDLSDGDSRMFVVNDTRVGLFRIEGSYYALDDHCPHAGASLSLGYVTGDIVACRIHHWRFCIRDGRYLDEDRPACNVKPYPVRVRNGQVEVEL